MTAVDIARRGRAFVDSSARRAPGKFIDDGLISAVSDIEGRKSIIAPATGAVYQICVANLKATQC